MNTNPDNCSSTPPTIHVGRVADHIPRNLNFQKIFIAAHQIISKLVIDDNGRRATKALCEKPDC